MVLYTIVPGEVIFEEESEEAAAVNARGRNPLTLTRGQAATLWVETAERGGFGYIRHIFSTDPRDYLDPLLQPGQRIDLGAAEEGERLNTG